MHGDTTGGMKVTIQDMAHDMRACQKKKKRESCLMHVKWMMNEL